MTTYEAPGKVNLSLLVGPPVRGGYHRIESLVQTIEWCDLLEVDYAEEGKDSVEVVGAELDPDDNLVTQTLTELRRSETVPQLQIRLTKVLPSGAGLGGGSSDAAAMLLAAGVASAAASEIASRLGSDVSLFLVGGTMMIGGRGEQVERLPALEGFALAIAVPQVALSTAEVYRRWDELGGPEGELLPEWASPPVLRQWVPLRNDLLPAALSLAPELGEFMAELRVRWDTAVALTGSGSACFAFFGTLGEAKEAAETAASFASVTRGVELRDRGVASV